MGEDLHSCNICPRNSNENSQFVMPRRTSTANTVGIRSNLSKGESVLSISAALRLDDSSERVTAKSIFR